MISSDLALLIAAGAMLALAAAADMRARLIPNWLTLPAIFAGAMVLFIRCLYSYPVLPALAIGAASLLIAGLPWIAECWGGGDAKACLAVLLLASPAFPGLYFAIAFTGSLALLLTARHICPVLSRKLPGEAADRRPLGGWLLTAYLLSAVACTVYFRGSP